MRRNKGFTLIELIVIIAIVGILVGLSTGLYKGYTKEANLSKHLSYIKELESASERYYMKEGGWPRLGDEPYTSEQLASYAERIMDLTGKQIELEPEGKYYTINYQEISKYTKIPKDKSNYILQNPIGRVYYLENLTEQGKSELNSGTNGTIPEKPSEPIREPLTGEIVINNYEDLNNIRNNLTGKYILMSDIDLKGYTWEPIGTNSNKFKGTLDGNGFKIKNLVVNSNAYSGLFSSLDTSNIKNVALTNVDITGTIGHTGGLAGTSFSSNIENSYATGRVVGGNYVGGLLGSVSGISKVNNSYFNGEVKGISYVGGLAGSYGNMSEINNSYAKGTVEGTGNYVGGFVGNLSQAYIYNSYAVSTVKGVARVGGLVGSSYSNSKIINSYSISAVTGNDKVGGLIGIHDWYTSGGYTYRTTITNSYYNTDIYTTSDGGIGLTTEKMKIQNNYTSWDFVNIWGIQEGTDYPKLRWQN